MKTPAILGIDVETTGLDPEKDRIIELAMPRWDGVAWDTSYRSWTLLDPSVSISAEVTKITGIRNEDVKGKPNFHDIAGRVEQRIRKHVDDGGMLLAYNARFDRAFIQAELSHVLPSAEQWLDPLVWMRYHLRHLKNKLEVACAEAGVPLENAHRADADARASIQLMLAIKRRLAPEVSWSKMLEVQSDLRGLLDDEFKRFGYHLYLCRQTGAHRIGFGKHQGTLLSECEPSYLEWCLENLDVTDETRSIMEAAVEAMESPAGLSSRCG